MGKRNDRTLCTTWTAARAAEVPHAIFVNCKILMTMVGGRTVLEAK